MRNLAVSGLVAASEGTVLRFPWGSYIVLNGSNACTPGPYIEVHVARTNLKYILDEVSFSIISFSLIRIFESYGPEGHRDHPGRFVPCR